MADENRTGQEPEEVRISLSGEAYLALKEIADRKGIPLFEVLKDAIGLEVWYERVQEDGGRVIVERKGEQRELVHD